MEKTGHKNSTWRVLTLLVLILLLVTALIVLKAGRKNRNKLAVGENARVEYVHVEIQPPSELDFKTRDEIYQLRREAVDRYTELISNWYKPSYAVFGLIEDSIPWYGIEGQFYFGQGENSIRGPSEEARYILNPFLLVAAEFNGFWGQMISEAELEGFALYCAPYSLQWRPEESYAEVSYHASCVVMRQKIPLDLIAYNARDFNLNYIYVSFDDSVNIIQQDHPDEAYKNPQYIHHGGNCEYPGGCNNMSPNTPEINDLQVLGFPARVEIWLWEKEPESVDQTPDMRFIIHFQ
ncbi:MAG: hypothetical protein JXA25_19295 [Anaerolineales bacterium]|nr:hypothetical protein [Anaerolineales bacterium]